jgi:hypothetical protein
MPRDPRTSAAAVAALLLLAGCGGTAVPRASTEPSVPATTAPTDGNGSLVPTNLPSLSDLPTAKQTVISTKPPAEVLGADISWPQCPKGMGIPEKPTQGAPLPTAAARFVVLGLTNGPSFVANPCLADQVRWVADRHLMAAAYSVVSYPDRATVKRYGGVGPFDGGTRAGALSNVGYQAALFNTRTLKRVGLRTPFVWVDVEPVPKFAWSSDLTANAAVVQGMVRGYADAGYPTGFYSTPSLWQRVVGSWAVGSPEWRAAGETSHDEALNRCGPDWSIQGGQAVLGQWVEAGRDRNLTCPGVSADLARWFHQY